MTIDIATMPVQERYKHLLDVISGKRFLNKQGLGNEVPFFICPFMPEEAVAMERMQRQLRNKLEQSGIPVLDINLYDVSIAILKQRSIWDRTLDIEATEEKAKLQEMLQGVLDPEAHLVPEIAKRMQNEEFDVMFISGVGEVFPYIRSHNVLNNLQRVAKEQPTVMFFPGTYTHSMEKGASLDLFGRLHDDKYYRAFNIYLREA